MKFITVRVWRLGVTVGFAYVPDLEAAMADADALLAEERRVAESERREALDDAADGLFEPGS